MYFARSPEPDFHPEFGFMCPSSHFRRVVRVAIVSIAFGATAGAIAVFALAPRADLARDKAFSIIFADEAAAANGAPAATTGQASSPSAAGADRVPVTSHQPAQGNRATNPATNAENANAADSEVPKASPKKRKKKVVQHRPPRRDREVADTRDPGAFATPYGYRFEQPRRDGGWDW